MSSHVNARGHESPPMDTLSAGEEEEEENDSNQEKDMDQTTSIPTIKVDSPPPTPTVPAHNPVDVKKKGSGKVFWAGLTHRKIENLNRKNMKYEKEPVVMCNLDGLPGVGKSTLVNGLYDKFHEERIGLYDVGTFDAVDKLWELPCNVQQALIEGQRFEDIECMIQTRMIPTVLVVENSLDVSFDTYGQGHEGEDMQPYEKAAYIQMRDLVRSRKDRLQFELDKHFVHECRFVLTCDEDTCMTRLEERTKKDGRPDEWANLKDKYTKWTKNFEASIAHYAGQSIKQLTELTPDNVKKVPLFEQIPSFSKKPPSKDHRRVVVYAVNTKVLSEAQVVEVVSIFLHRLLDLAEQERVALEEERKKEEEKEKEEEEKKKEKEKGAEKDKEGEKKVFQCAI